MVNYTWLMLILSWRFQMSFPPYIGLFLTRMWLFAESDLAPLLPLRRRPLHFSSAYNNANKECICHDRLPTWLLYLPNIVCVGFTPHVRDDWAYILIGCLHITGYVVRQFRFHFASREAGIVLVPPLPQ